MASRKITDLVPELQDLYGCFKSRMEDACIDFIVTCTRRTQDDQDYLYAQGRTRPGPIVTWTRTSKHVEGKAFDIAIIENGKITWEPAPYIEAGKIGEAVGLSWGGRWLKSPDRPHFQLKE